MKYVAALIIIFTLCNSCDSSESTKANGTFLSGEIINPVQSYILLYKNEKVTDSIPLDRRNKFSYTFSNLEEGLYRFVHGEFQLLHIEEGDSLLLRVNTKEFDESLTFSGYGAAKNNFLINKFLHWEEENNFLKQRYQKNPENFEKMLDSMAIVHTRGLNEFLAKENFSDNFSEIASAASVLDNYQRKEWYPFARYGEDKYEFIKNLNPNFYNFRESVDLNNRNIEELFSFQRYVNSYMNNLAYMEYGDQHNFDRTSYLHNHHKVKMIDSLITNSRQKERMLKQVARIFIANSNDLKKVDALFDEIKEVSSSQETIEALNDTYANNKSMQAGNKIPKLAVLNTEGKANIMSKAFESPSVLYFWSYLNLPHMKSSHQKAAELQKKYPEFNFVGININTEQDTWLKHLQKNGYSSQKEFRFLNPKQARKQLVINDINKTIVLDKNGTILNSHANLQNAKFENDLIAYLKL
ncbi:TlpA family protein disulfide reductase [Dokdonia sp. Hel_I_53]|uniref:TlpA family protein disulfide reductase n=1 Tax=Dokdonia sp. Hel_I_53 TaxID=1566287 RepID=UPI00119BC724|nr:thioredoxin-like domain-containing protein [Dokdonia sp. Hel_I_53]TVZ51034.1 thiol-disulfide isomerase/thioredoxin [Dokdonia sp. Hel_I_53]